MINKIITDRERGRLFFVMCTCIAARLPRYKSAECRVLILDHRCFAGALVLRRDRFSRAHSGDVVVIRDRLPSDKANLQLSFNRSLKSFHITLNHQCKTDTHHSVTHQQHFHRKH